MPWNWKYNCALGNGPARMCCMCVCVCAFACMCVCVCAWQDTGSGVYHPHLKCFPLCKPKRHGYSQHHLTCRASSYSSCSHTRLLTYSHRQPYITAPKIKSSSHTRTSIATTPKKMSFNLLLKQSANHHHPSTSSK